MCGLNPHAGESGIFGDEDQTMIIPAVITAKGRNIDVSGPHPADTVFFQAIHNDRYDAIVCMYLDQGHAPMKIYAFQTGVNRITKNTEEILTFHYHNYNRDYINAGYLDEYDSESVVVKGEIPLIVAEVPRVNPERVFEPVVLVV